MAGLDRVAEDGRETARSAALRGAEHLARYRAREAERQPAVEDVQAAVAAFRQALALASGEPAAAPAYAYNLAIALQSRYDAVGEPADDDADLREAVVVLQDALAVAQHEQTGPYVPVAEYALGSALRRLHGRTGDQDVLDRSIGLLGDALQHADPGGLDQADCLLEYGRALLTRSEQQDDGAALQEAVRVLDWLVEGADPADPELAAYLDAAGSARLRRFDLEGATDDLTAAVRLARSAVAASRKVDGSRATAMGNLSAALFTSGSQHRGVHPDLDEAIAVLRSALEIVCPAGGDEPVGTPARDRLAGLRSNLAGFLLARVERSGDLSSLDEAVQLCEQAVRGTRPGAPALAARAHQLAVARRTRYLRADDVGDLEAAVAAHQLALASPAADSERRALLDSWGNTLRTKFDRSGALADLQAAIEAYERSLSEPDPAPGDRAARLMNLGAALAARAQETADTRVADRARDVLQEAVDRAVPGTLERARALINLGNVLAEQFDRTAQTSYQEQAEAIYAEVLRDTPETAAVNTELLLQAALNAGEWAFDRGAWTDAVDHLTRALDAVDALVALQRSRADKESWLRDARGAATRAAGAAMRVGDLQQAVVLVERGRALLLTEALEQSRLDLDALDAAGAHELRLLVEAAATTWVQDGGPGADGLGRTVDLRTLRDEIRAVPGFEGFLAPATFDDIDQAAGDRRLVYVTTGERAGFALVVGAGSVEAVELTSLTEQAVRARVDALLEASERLLDDPLAHPQWIGALDEVGAWLWTSAVAPLLPHLRRDAVAVVAGGLLGLLPLHAAYTADDRAVTGRRYLVDELCVSYVPNARALEPHQQRQQGRAGARLLAVAAPEPSTLPLLPGTRAEALAAAAAFAGGPEAPSLLAGPDARLGTVTSGLRSCQVVHFGCHGRADVAVPLSSALLLADDQPLTLAHVLRLDVQLRLAVLSACETARPGTALPDEVVSLPTGLLQAGAAGVVATGWPVPDGATAALVTEFYRRWRWEEQSPGAALAGAQTWLRDTTNEQKVAHWERAVEAAAPWLPDETAELLFDEYLVREPDALDDAGIGVWAGFAHFGR